MGLDDLEHEWRQFKRTKKKIIPFSDDLEMVNQLQEGVVFFFPWLNWILPILFGLALTVMGIGFSWYNLTFWEDISFFDPIRMGFIIVSAGGFFFLMMGLVHFRRFMAISAEGISLPRWLRKNLIIPWTIIRRISVQSNIWDSPIEMIIHYGSKTAKTNLTYYRRYYFSGGGQEYQIIRALQTYLQSQFFGMDMKRVRKQIKREHQAVRKRSEDVPEIALPIILLIISGILSWFFVIPFVLQSLMLICMFLFGVTLILVVRYRKAWHIRSFKKRIALLLAVLLVLLFIIILLVLFPPLLAPFLPPPFRIVIILVKITQFF